MTFIPKNIIVHCSDTEDTPSLSWDAIRRYHMQVKGWRDIGYHAGVELIGSAYEAMIGRAWDVMGAHCAEAGMNEVSMGVCVVGAFEKSAPPDEQMTVLRDRILEPWMKMFAIPASNIYPHRRFAPWKTCPGTMLTDELLTKWIPVIPTIGGTS